MILLLGLGGCASASTRETIHIRIRNASDFSYAKFWLGAGSGDGGQGSHVFGEIAAGETTPYATLPACYSAYGKFNFIGADGGRYLGTALPRELVGSMSSCRATTPSSSASKGALPGSRSSQTSCPLTLVDAPKNGRIAEVLRGLEAGGNGEQRTDPGAI